MSGLNLYRLALSEGTCFRVESATSALWYHEEGGGRGEVTRVGSGRAEHDRYRFPCPFIGNNFVIRTSVLEEEGVRPMAKGGKSKKKAETVFLVCEETGDYNYTLRRKPGGEKLKLRRYCPRLRKHTVHVEKKK
jgi:large subunit ribosomal protein L33